MGRGLVVLTAAVGGMLTLTLLWAMLPPASSPGPLAVASTAISRPTERAPRSSTSFAASSTATPAGPVTTSGAVSTLERPSSTAPRTTAPRPVATVAPPGVVVSPAPPMAVALAGTDLAVTTARAAGSATTLTVTLVEGKVVQAEVIAVDTDSGLAVLGLPDDVSTKALQVASGRDGQQVMVGGQEPHPAVLTTDAVSGALTVAGDDALDTAEGTPVTDSAGNLIGLCSWRDGVAQLIAIGDVTALDEMVPEPPGWMGVQLSGDPADPLTIAAVDASGPAAAAGVQPGDGIVALDGVVVTSVAQLTGLLDERHAGDPVVLQVRRAGGDIAVTITLAAQPDL
jgi:S1-C subfamily serine protease